MTFLSLKLPLDVTFKTFKLYLVNELKLHSISSMEGITFSNGSEIANTFFNVVAEIEKTKWAVDMIRRSIDGTYYAVFVDHSGSINEETFKSQMVLEIA